VIGDPDVSADVEQAITEWDGEGEVQPIRPDRVTATEEYKDARAAFKDVRNQHAAALGLGPRGQVHHSIELQVMNRYPGVFDADELNDLSNMRGIPRELTNDELAAAAQLQDATPEAAIDPAKYVTADGTRMQLHGVAIRDLWDRHYAALDARIEELGLEPGTDAYTSYVREYLTDARAEADHIYGQFFSEYRELSDRHDASLDARIKELGLEPGTDAYYKFVREYSSDALPDADEMYGRFDSKPNESAP